MNCDSFSNYDSHHNAGDSVSYCSVTSNHPLCIYYGTLRTLCKQEYKVSGKKCVFLIKGHRRYWYNKRSPTGASDTKLPYASQLAFKWEAILMSLKWMSKMSLYCCQEILKFTLTDDFHVWLWACQLSTSWNANPQWKPGFGSSSV